jgi:hypothetical protein
MGITISNKKEKHLLATVCANDVARDLFGNGNKYFFYFF